MNIYPQGTRVLQALHKRFLKYYCGGERVLLLMECIVTEVLEEFSLGCVLTPSEIEA